MKTLTLVLSLAIANFAWQAFTEQRYGVALERTYFQAVALLLAWWLT